MLYTTQNTNIAAFSLAPVSNTIALADMGD